MLIAASLTFRVETFFGALLSVESGTEKAELKARGRCSAPTAVR